MEEKKLCKSLQTSSESTRIHANCMELYSKAKNTDRVKQISTEAKDGGKNQPRVQVDITGLASL